MANKPIDRQPTQIEQKTTISEQLQEYLRAYGVHYKDKLHAEELTKQFKATDDKTLLPQISAINQREYYLWADTRRCLREIIRVTPIATPFLETREEGYSDPKQLEPGYVPPQWLVEQYAIRHIENNKRKYWKEELA